MRRLPAHFVDDLLQLLFANAEAPVRDEAARMRDRGVGKRLADNCHRNAVDLAQCIRRKHCVAEVRGPYILSDEIDVARELARYELLHALGAVSEFPMRGHHVDAQKLRGLDHVLAPGPQSGRGALPGITAVEDQRAGAVSLQTLDERRELGEAPELAVKLRGVSEVEAGERVCLAGSRLDPETLQQRFADQVRRSPFRDTDAEIDVGLAEVRRQQLRVAVGEVQQMHIAETRQRIECVGLALCICRARIESESGRSGASENVQKFAAIHRANITPVGEDADRRKLTD